MMRTDPQALPPVVSQEDWEAAREAFLVNEKGWPQGPRYSWWRHHDRYDAPGG